MHTHSTHYKETQGLEESEFRGPVDVKAKILTSAAPILSPDLKRMGTRSHMPRTFFLEPRRSFSPSST